MHDYSVACHWEEDFGFPLRSSRLRLGQNFYIIIYNTLYYLHRLSLNKKRPGSQKGVINPKQTRGRELGFKIW